MNNWEKISVRKSSDMSIDLLASTYTGIFLEKFLEIYRSLFGIRSEIFEDYASEFFGEVINWSNLLMFRHEQYHYDYTDE